jgi:hypothetical protein
VCRADLLFHCRRVDIPGDQQPDARQVGEFLLRNQITEGGVVPFFTMMALVMVLARETILPRRIAKLPTVAGRSAPQRSADDVRRADFRERPAAWRSAGAG